MKTPVVRSDGPVHRPAGRDGRLSSSQTNLVIGPEPHVALLGRPNGHEAINPPAMALRGAWLQAQPLHHAIRYQRANRLDVARFQISRNRPTPLSTPDSGEACVGPHETVVNIFFVSKQVLEIRTLHGTP